MTTLARFVLRHALIGMGTAIGFVALLLGFDIAHLGALVGHSDVGPLAVAVMTVFFAITFGSAQVGFALLFLARENESGRPARPLRPLVPARVQQRARQTRV